MCAFPCQTLTQVQRKKNNSLGGMRRDVPPPGPPPFEASCRREAFLTASVSQISDGSKSSFPRQMLVGYLLVGGFSPPL